MKRAVLLMAYGTPAKEEDIEPYYTDIRRGRKPTEEEVQDLTERYKVIGGISPLLAITNSTAEKLEKRLGQKVYTGMKHWHPYVSETFERITSDGVTDIIALALAPHYSKMSIGGYHDSVTKANTEQGSKVKVTFINEWHLDPVFIQKWKKKIQSAEKTKFKGVDHDKIFFLFSAHSLPEHILAWNDPYKTQLLETMQKLASELGLDPKHFGFAFQSAGHTTDPWLGPDILDKVRDLAKEGWKEILSIPIGFVSDHLEILFDIDVEAKQVAKELNVHLERTESFNDGDDFIDVLESVVKHHG